MDLSSHSPQPLPVALSLDLPVGQFQELPVLSIPCSSPNLVEPLSLSWSELLGER